MRSMVEGAAAQPPLARRYPSVSRLAASATSPFALTRK
jgi:hypothetical protein